jgi:calcineurin-like phosphoesterase family protein
MKRFFTADFHLGSSLLLNEKVMKRDVRKFKSVEKMNAAFIRSCCERASDDDIIIHCGDFASYGMDRGNKGLEINPKHFIDVIPAQMILLKGNHDLNNKCKPVANSLRINLGKVFKDVSISHYPSYSVHAKINF